MPPLATCPPVDVSVPIYKSHPIVVLQDSKHALKTFRNNLFLGVRLLTLGNYVAIYHHIQQLAHEAGTPIYIRDVQKLDRQDDNAASRLFSAATLEFLSDHYPDYIGEIVYLFIFGELVDAYQNRTIPHVERVKMVLRARYFLAMWHNFLSRAQYKIPQHFISREAADIARILIDGFLGLILVYRDHLPRVNPLLPWLHSSEACEHVFGKARQIVKDFTMLDFYYMIPKLHVKLQEAAFRAKLSNPKARASGYTHTYFDGKGTDLHTLSHFPMNDEIASVALQAAQEAEALTVLLGLSPKQLSISYNMSQVVESGPLPSIKSWLAPAANTALDSLDDDEANNNSNSDKANDTNSDKANNGDSEASVLQYLIDEEERRQFHPENNHQDDEHLLSLTCAAFAITAAEFTKM
jgi:hypothetical protein